MPRSVYRHREPNLTEGESNHARNILRVQRMPRQGRPPILAHHPIDPMDRTAEPPSSAHRRIRVYPRSKSAARARIDGRARRMGDRMNLYAWLALLLRLHACRVYEDLSALCGIIPHGVPW